MIWDYLIAECKTIRGDYKMIEIGDLVEWAELTIHPNDMMTIYQRIKDGRRLDSMIMSNLSSYEKHTGMISNIVENQIVIMDFVGRCEISIHMEEAYEKLTILNKK